MDAQFQPYPAYKPSGAEWLGEVPVHWRVDQLGRIGKFSKGSGGTKEDEVPDGLPCVRYGDIYMSHKYFIHQSRSCIAPERAPTYTPIQRGDILFAGSGETLGEIGKSAVNLIEGEAYCGGDVILFRPATRANHVFLGYVCDSLPAIVQKSQMGRGITVMHIYSSELKYLWVALPPKCEQDAIVRYLDHTDGRIQRYIDAKERLIALLEEEKQAIINRAVTRGLNPNVTLKPSGVEWLGDVPAHWAVEQLGRIGKFSKGSGGTKEDDVSDGLPCVRYGDIYMSHKYFIHQSRSCIAPERAPAYTPIQRGDILFAGSGETLEEIGKSAVNLIEGEAYCGGDVILFRPATRANHVFMGYVCDSLPAIVQKSQMGRGITVMHIYSSELKYLWVALPPKCEQDAMAAYLETATTDLDKVIAGARRQIELLREYRTRLISDVVTGKLDVREAESNLPDEDADSNAPTLA